MNLRINLNEAAFANGRSGTLDAEMAESWLNGLESWACSPMAYAYWTEARVNYIASFGERTSGRAGR